MNPIFVGLDLGIHDTEPLHPRFGSGRRLADLSGMPSEVFRHRADRINLYPVSSPRRSYDPETARNLLPLLRGRRVVVLGRRVASAIGTPNEWMKWSVCDGFVGATLPHPSGLNRWWNDPGNRLAAASFVQGSLRPCVHVEGPDGSGKTRLVEELARLLGVKSIPTDDPPQSWDECLGRIGRRVQPGVVCDRSSGLVSELVYAPVLRGGTLAPEKYVWAVVRSLVYAVTFVYCRPPKVRPSFRKGEDPAHIRAVLAKSGPLRDRYDEVMSRLSREGARVFTYDWTRQSPEEVAVCVA